MQNLVDLEPGPASPKRVRMVVEIPKDSGHKYEYEPSLGLFLLSRSLHSPMHYPGDYGFIPGTVAEDEQPLDIIALASSPSFTGCLIEARPVALLDMMDGPTVDHKIIAVATGDPRYATIADAEDLRAHIRRELEHFFAIYKELEGRVMQLRAWAGAREAHRIIEESRARYLAAKTALT